MLQPVTCHSALCPQPDSGAGSTGRDTGFYSRSFIVHALEFPSLVSRVVLINIHSPAGYSCPRKSLSDSVTEMVLSLRISLLPLKGEIGWAPTSCLPFQVPHSRPVPGEITKSVFVSSFCSRLL